MPQAGCDLSSLSREKLLSTCEAARLTQDLCDRALADANALAYETLKKGIAKIKARSDSTSMPSSLCCYFMHLLVSPILACCGWWV